MLSAYSIPTGDDYDHEAILGDPAWWAVANEAKCSIERLRAILRDPEELKTLSHPTVEALRATRSEGAA